MVRAVLSSDGVGARPKYLRYMVVTTATRLEALTLAAREACPASASLVRICTSTVWPFSGRACSLPIEGEATCKSGVSTNRAERSVLSSSQDPDVEGIRRRGGRTNLPRIASTSTPASPRSRFSMKKSQTQGLDQIDHAAYKYYLRGFRRRSSGLAGESASGGDDASKQHDTVPASGTARTPRCRKSQRPHRVTLVDRDPAIPCRTRWAVIRSGRIPYVESGIRPLELRSRAMGVTRSGVGLSASLMLSLALMAMVGTAGVSLAQAQVPAPAGASAVYWVYVGTYTGGERGRGIYLMELDVLGGRLGARPGWRRPRRTRRSWRSTPTASSSTRSMNRARSRGAATAALARSRSTSPTGRSSC